MTELLTDRTAVVTGGASGNGRAIARTMADHGADVVVADVREEPREGGEPTHEVIESETDRTAVFVECDVTSYEDTLAAAEVAAELGGLDAWVNNAGVLRLGDVTEVTEEDYDVLMGINLKGVFLGTKAAAEYMDTGAIVNISSTVGLVGQPGNSLYSASKGGVTLFTYAHAGELAPDIRVNAVHPGTTETMMVTEDIEILGTEHGEEELEEIALNRFGRSEDVANAVTFLASDMASYVTAESLLVDGGIVNARPR
jgi:NAD(P)-dependent dehydrogenase (short-subunit alcohol dehydrogenase family)